MWNSRIVRRQIESIARTTAGIYKINQRQLLNIEVPIVSASVQRDVAARLAHVRAAEAALFRECDKSRARSASLRRALLAAAFGGRLTGRSFDLDVPEELAFA